MTQERIKQIEEVIEKEIRPALQADGGDVELVSLEDDGVVKVRLKGACGGCPMATMTLKSGIQAKLCREFDFVKSVERV
jgi:Fe-S cluster biogenesis protein NfuA